MKKHTKKRARTPLVGMGTALSLALASTATSSQADTFTLEEATFADIQAAMDAGALTSVELVSLYLNRIAVYDQAGIFLNSTPVINPAVFDDAADADELRAQGTVLGPLHGIPFSVKATFSIQGMTTDGGSPALVNLAPAAQDALIVARLRAAGAVPLGKANLPPMGNGTNERSVYGPGKNPYNFAASTEGSSYGSAIGVAANLVGFSFGGDTTGSIRFPASAQNIVGLKPSKALFPTTGTWWLGWQQDVIGPMTRTVRDLAIISDLTIADYPSVPTNFEASFYEQASTFRPPSYEALLSVNAFAGKRVGVPKPFIGADFTGTSNYKIGPRVEALLRKAMDDMRALGAEVVEIDFPAFHTFARDNEAGIAGDGRRFTPAVEAYYFDAPTMANRVRAYYMDEVTKSFNDPVITSWGNVAQDTDVITYSTNNAWLQRRQDVRDGIMRAPTVELAGKPFGVGLVEGFDLWTKRDITDFLVANNIDVVVYPVKNNTAPLSAGETTAEFPNTYNFGGQASSLGLPGLVVPMGFLADSSVPMGLTFLGSARNTEDDILPFAYAYEQATQIRQAPAVTPPLPGETIEFSTVVAPVAEIAPPLVKITGSLKAKGRALLVSGVANDASGIASIAVYVNGQKIPASKKRKWTAKIKPNVFEKLNTDTLTILVVTKDIYGNTAVDTKTVKAPRA